MKPVIYAANVSEDELADGAASNSNVNAVREEAQKEGASVIIVSAQVESELVGLDDDEKVKNFTCAQTLFPDARRCSS